MRRKNQFIKRKWMGIIWSVDRRFREHDPDYADWKIVGHKGTIYRRNVDGIFVLIKTNRPQLTQYALINKGVPSNEIQITDGEVYIRGKIDNLALYLKVIGRKMPKTRIYTDAQKQAMAHRLKEYRRLQILE